MAKYSHETAQGCAASAPRSDIDRGNHTDFGLGLLELNVVQRLLRAVGTQDHLQLEFLRPAAICNAVQGKQVSEDRRPSRAGDLPELHFQAGAGDRLPA